jgi:hypothetical protein
MENIFTAFILVIGALGLYWMYIKVDKQSTNSTYRNSTAKFNHLKQPDQGQPLEKSAKLNPYLESINELELDLNMDITQSVIDEAYLKIAKRYILYLESNQEPPFKLSYKEGARNYLINFLKVRKNS